MTLASHENAERKYKKTTGRNEFQVNFLFTSMRTNRVRLVNAIISFLNAPPVSRKSNIIKSGLRLIIHRNLSCTFCKRLITVRI